MKAKRLYKLKGLSPYVDGIIGHDFHLSLWQRVKILFCSGISVFLMSEYIANKRDFIVIPREKYEFVQAEIARLKREAGETDE